MKLFHFSLLTLLCTAAISVTSCKKDEDTAVPGNVEIYLENFAGTDPLTFNKPYATAGNDTVSFTKFDYFLSNFILVNSKGEEYIVPKDSCYFLCKQDDAASRKLVLKNIPAGDYAQVKFTVGIDSLKSVSSIAERTGVLDPAAAASGMYWTWNSGYIFMKIEGTSPQAPLNSFTNERTVQYHTGGFGGLNSPTLNSIRQISVSSSTTKAKVSDKKTPEFHIYVDILEAFKNPTPVSVAAEPVSHGGPFTATIVNNSMDAFKLDHIHN
jgi:hypothetical protein